MDEKALVKFLRKKMKRVQRSHIEAKPFDFCFSQATFDLLMDIDIEFKLGAFYKKERE